MKSQEIIIDLALKAGENMLIHAEIQRKGQKTLRDRD
jgi:hypothetical protein